MSKKNEKAAPSEPERAEPIHGAGEYNCGNPECPECVDVSDGSPSAAELAMVNPPPVAPPADHAEVTFEQWAELKGHIKRLPKPGRPRAAYVLPGPDYRVIKVATQWPANKVVSEAEYEEAVVKTYGAEIRER